MPTGRVPIWPRLSPLAPLLAGALVGVGLLVGWRGVDLPAALYRVHLFQLTGFSLWDSQWFGGHWTFDYSLMFAAVSSGLTLAGLSVLSALTSAFAFDRLVRWHWGASGTVATIIFSGSVLAEFAIGQLSFLFGQAIGLCALVAAVRHRRVLAAVLALLTSMAAPLAGAFLVLAVIAWLVATWASSSHDKRTTAAAVALAAGLPVLVVGVVFPGVGPMPLPTGDMLWDLIVAATVGLLSRRSDRVLRVGVALYGVAVLGSWLISSPVGGNVGRLGDVFALPLAVLLVSGRRAVRLCWVTLPLLLSGWGPAWGALIRNPGQPSSHQAYFVAVRRYLETQDRGGLDGRIEAVPTTSHWETAYLAPALPLARGWERQLDTADNPIFYRPGALTPGSYRQWLLNNGVRYVALPDAPLDYSGIGEASLIRHGVAGLRLVWHDRHWRVYRFQASRGLVSGPARLQEASGGDLDLRATGPGTILLRYRYNRDWVLTAGVGCLRRTADDEIQVSVAGPEELRLQVRLLGGQTAANVACRSGARPERRP